MNKTNDGIKYGITQYCAPHCFELSGNTYRCTAQDGREIAFEFKDTHTVSFTIDGKEELSQYEALKADSETYIVSFGLVFKAAVFDFESGAVTVSGDNDGEFIFCCLNGTEGVCHNYTDDMCGTNVRWVLGNDRYIENKYLEDGKCRFTWSPLTEKQRTVPYTAVKIKEAVYLTETNSTAPFNAHLSSNYSKIVLLQNYDRLITFGAAYSPITRERILISGYGLPVDDAFEKKSSVESRVADRGSAF